MWARQGKSLLGDQDPNRLRERIHVGELPVSAIRVFQHFRRHEVHRPDSLPVCSDRCFSWEIDQPEVTQNPLRTVSE